MSSQIKCPECGNSLAPGALEGLCPACLLSVGAAGDSNADASQPSFTPWPVAEVSRWFPKLEIQELIGRGGMGAIYRARQPGLDRLVAVKILPGNGPKESGFAERFNREARALAKLNHPNIITVHEFGQVEGYYYFIMEYVDGVNLRQLQRTGRLAPREALQIVPQLCDALQYAHDEGVVHRDIKPENVLIDRKGRVKIADFGLAKMLGLERTEFRLTGEGQVMGTPHYMAPEQVEHPLDVDHRADIYALGVVFYEMLTGELPLGHFAPPSRKVQVDVRLDEVVLRALAKEPELRYQQANEVKTAVQDITSSPPTPASSQSPNPPIVEQIQSAHPNFAPSPRRLGRALTASILVFLAVFGTAAIITFLMPKSYLGTARIEVSKPLADQSFDPYFLQTQFEVIRSDEVLLSVVEPLHLAERWASRFGLTEPLPERDLLQILRSSLNVRQSRSTSVVEIHYYGKSPGEAAAIANAIAEAAQAKAKPNRYSIIDRAQPWSKPVRPNVPVNLFLGALLGLALGGAAGGALLLLPRTKHASASSGSAPWLTWKAVTAASLAVLVCMAIVLGGSIGQHSRTAELEHEPLTPFEEAPNAGPTSPPLAPPPTVSQSVQPVSPLETPAPLGAIDNGSTSPKPLTTEQSRPALRFLARQPSKATDELKEVWSPTGQLPEPREQQLALDLGEMRSDLSGFDGGSNAVVFCFWFADPLLDLQSQCVIRVSDPSGKIVPAFQNTVSSKLKEPASNREELGWFVCAFPFPSEQEVPPFIGVSLDYTVGPWVEKQKILLKQGEGQAIATAGGLISGMGETAEGDAFISLAGDSSANPIIKYQYDFEAETKGGQRLTRKGLTTLGIWNLSSQQYRFATPIRNVAAFRLRARPIRTVEFRNVSLRPKQMTSFFSYQADGGSNTNQR